jgi:Flp pilus assembly protein TadB
VLLAAGVSNPTSVPAPSRQSPLRVCLKYLEEGHDPATALEFVAEWGQGDVKRQFQAYVKLLQQGRPLELILEEIALAYPSPETELLIASIESRLATGNFPDVTPAILADAESLEMRAREDMQIVIGSARRWTLGLVWSGILGGAMLIIAFPQYSHAFLESRVGRVVFGVAIALEVIGLLWAGMLLRLQSRIERELTQP